MNKDSTENLYKIFVEHHFAINFRNMCIITFSILAAVPEPKNDGSDLIKKQEEMFNSMENQYEVARLATHTHRGVGLGFGTFQPR